MQTLRARQVPWGNPVGVGLREALRAETDRGHVLPGGASEDGDGIIVFLIVYEVATGQPVGCGGLRSRADGRAEAESVYVVPYARWSGVGAAILEELACWARVHGIATTVADATLDEAANLRL